MTCYTTPPDQVSISSIGKSQKLEDTKSIGKYGLGFNTCYHMSDFVSFISSGQMVIFDPHGESLPDGQLGLRCDYTDPAFQKLYPAHREAFEGVKASLMREGGVEEGEGTLFRMALRSDEAASVSEICDTKYSHEAMT